MANVSFYRQTTGATATGAITFDTTNKYIYLGDGTTAHTFDCNNTDTYGRSGNTSSKIYLIGRTSQSTSNGTTYSHDTVYVGTDGFLYTNSNRAGTGWVTLNGTTGVGYSNFMSNSTYTSANTIYVKLDAIPVSLLFPRLVNLGSLSTTSKSATMTLYFVMDKLVNGMRGYNSSYLGWCANGRGACNSHMFHNLYSDSSTGYSIWFDSVFLWGNRDTDHLSSYYGFWKTNSRYVGAVTDGDYYTDTDSFYDGDASPYIKIMAVKY